MNKTLRMPAYAAALSSLALISACGGGGGSNTPTPPSPPPSAPAPPPPPVPPPVNAAPAFSTQSLSTSEEVDGSAQLTATDAENQALTYAIATQPLNGTATLTAAGALTYSPAPNYFGADSLTITVTDSAGASTTGTVNITVTNVNDAPVVQDDRLRVTVTPGQPIVLAAIANDEDDDGDALTPTIVAQPAHGGTIAVDATTRVMTFQPTNGYVGPIEFSYRVNDGAVDSSVATVRAVIGAFENVAFLSDYSTPGLQELHVYDGIEVRRFNDPLPAGSSVSSFTYSGDAGTIAYTVTSSDADRVYIKSVTGNSPAVMRYVSVKPNGATFGVSGGLNADGTQMWVYDGYYAYSNQDRKEYFVFDTATGTARQIAGDMSGVLDIRLLQWHPNEPNTLVVQGQTAGNVPADGTSAVSVFIGSAADVRTLTQIGRTYASGEHGSGEGFYFGSGTRYLYYTEYKRSGMSGAVTNLLRYDREGAGSESAVVRMATLPDQGMNGVVSTSPDRGRMCFSYYEASTTTYQGPSKFFALDPATPGSEAPVTGVLNFATGCTMAADNRTMIFRQYDASHGYQQAFVVDSVTPGTPVVLAPAAETNSEQGAWHVAPHAMRVAVAYHDNDGLAGNTGQLGRFYSLPADGTGDGFLFSDSYQPSFIVGGVGASNGDGSFLIHTRSQGAIHKLELMSTHGLNLSIPVSAAGETLGVKSVRWLRRY